MQMIKTASLKKEQKELLIFLSVTFGLTFLMGIPMAILFHAGKEVSFLGSTQMLYPAAGLMLAKLICDKGKSLMPKTFFIGFLVLTGIMILWCFAPFFLPDQITADGQMDLSIAGAIIIFFAYLMSNDEAHSTYGLKSKNWNLSIRLLGLFVALKFAAIFLSGITSGSLAEVFSFLPSHLLGVLERLPLGFFFSFYLCLGEEYGWRYYFQPLLQQKFGLIKGVFAFVLLWNLWHLPLVFFYYAPVASMTSPMALVQLILIRLISTTSIGIFMAYAYMRTNNVWLAVLIHFLHDASASTASGGTTDQEFTWLMLGLYALIQIGLYLPFLFSKVFRKQSTT